VNPNADPEFVVLAGDWHGNWKWATHAVERAHEMLSEVGESRKIIIQLGDFGFRIPVRTGPESEENLSALHSISLLLEDAGMELWWIDGNHEDWLGIRRLIAEAGTAPQLPYPVALPLPGMPAIRYLPRGTRWKWAGRRWLAVGGAVSVDKLLRTPGVDWHPDEEVTEEEAERIIATGPADVLLSHDVPDCWFPSRLPAPADAWLPMLPVARAHSRLLERVARRVGVTRVFHGHYHVFRDDWFPGKTREPDVKVTGLPMDGSARNLLMMDVRML
jgi:hypothetical protein